MPETPADVLLITADQGFRALVGRHRPPAAQLRCVAAADLPAVEPVRAQQVWVDLDSAPSICGPYGARRVYFYSCHRPATEGLPAGLFIRKPCGPAVFDLLWSAVGLKPAGHAATTAPPVRPLPAWLLDFQEIRLVPLCRKLVGELAPRLGYRYGSLYLHDFKRGLLTLAESSHTRSIDLAVPLDAADRHLMVAVAHGERLLRTQHATDVSLAYGIPPHADRPYPDDACLVAPLSSAGRLWGVLNFSGRVRTPLTEADPPLEETFTFLGRALHQARTYDQARTEARVDSLTGLYNQRWIIETLEKEVRRTERFGTPLAVLMIDLDGLKGINDREGHAAGDCLLQHVATRINRVLRQFDGAARVGGDEFVVMLPATNMKGAQRVARRLLASIRQDVAHFRNVPLPVTASIGAAAWCPGRDAQQLIEAADRTMYRAKQNGRNSLVCELHEPPSRRPRAASGHPADQPGPSLRSERPRSADTARAAIPPTAAPPAEAEPTRAATPGAAPTGDRAE